MRGAAAAALVCVVFAAACAKRESPAPASAAAAEPKPPEGSLASRVQYRETNNLAALANGGVIVERSGEEALDRSAVYAIDSFPESAWVTPSGDPMQTAVVALASPSRITQIGMTTRGGGGPARALRQLRVEASSDRMNWRELGVVESPKPADYAKLQIAPADASFLRLTLLKGASPRSAVELPSVEVLGSPLEPRRVADVSGRWTMPGGEVVLAQERRRLSGRCSMVMSDLLQLEGRVENGIASFSWIRGPEVGFGALAVSHEGDVLNAVLWHEKPIAFFPATSWIAQRNGSADVPPRDERAAVLQFLTTIGRYPSYAITFDEGAAPGEITPGHLDMLLSVVSANPQHKFKLAVMHAAARPEGENKRITGQRAAALRAAIEKRGADFANLTVIGRGSHFDHDPPLNELDRKLYDRVDLEIESFDSSRSIQTLRLR